MSDNFYKDSKPSWGKSVLIPFICGALGAFLVLGITLGSPSIKSRLLGNSNFPSTKETSSGTISSSGNLEQVSLTNYSDTAIYAANKVLPSIAQISVEYNVKSNMFLMGPQNSTVVAEGSGIIISKDGYILTNNHIINSTDSSSYYTVTEAASIKVSLYNDDTVYEAKIIGSDAETDLAVIKIEKDDLVAAEIGDSDSVKIGEFALAIGNPLGMQSSVSSGIISALNRSVDVEDGQNFTLIQTDAAINSGNSGGALVNSKGEVIGLNTLKMSGTGIEGMGFAIPINDTIDIYNELIKNGKIARPYIGISGIDVDEATSKKYSVPVGIYVQAVENFSSAKDAGIKTGDVITSADDKEIQTMEELNNIKKDKKVGDKIKLEITRDDEKITVEVTLKEKP